MPICVGVQSNNHQQLDGVLSPHTEAAGAGAGAGDGLLAQSLTVNSREVEADGFGSGGLVGQAAQVFESLSFVGVGVGLFGGEVGLSHSFVALPHSLLLCCSFLVLLTGLDGGASQTLLLSPLVSHADTCP